jgi:hypothetical protein
MKPRGRAYVDSSNPKATAECDRCGFVFHRVGLQPQMRYAGVSIVDTGWRVCESCLDPLDPQQKPQVPGVDGLPIPDPRPRST